MKEIPNTTTEALLKKSGAKRVSKKAQRELNKKLIYKLQTTTKKAKNFAEHARRKTIKKEDIYLAS